MEIPPDIIERSQLLTAQVWEVAQSIANDRLMKEQEALTHTKALAQQDVDEANQMVRTLEKEQTELLTKLEAVKQ